MTFHKSLFIATLSLALFAFSAPVNAATEAKPAVAAQPAAAPTTAPVAPAAAMAPAAAPAANAAEIAPRLARLQQVVDIKNLPKDVSRIVPLDGDTFIVAVGETKVLTAARPRKCTQNEAPSFEDTKLRLPNTDLLTYTDGGLRERFSRRCSSLKPARVILATGAKAGTYKLPVLGMTLTVIVK